MAYTGKTNKMGKLLGDENLNPGGGGQQGNNNNGGGGGNNGGNNGGNGQSQLTRDLQHDLGRGRLNAKTEKENKDQGK